ncbi:hypothetical protein [Photobacterium sanguinicancri]|uniref:hypothetical protein n=1 Tax=Photobacterium sanguinicancri TaxID=875932 RepID=UPI0026E3217D|nr:hypothetical protein [Photobacterium sanguinicancri]MDO6496844.1 hypothetical protein [Photobacterium sanguinicancri]
METITEQETEIEANDSLEHHSHDEEQAFLNTFKDDVDFDPTQTDIQTKEKPEKMSLDAAAGIVFVGLMTAESTLKMAVHKDFKFDADQAENVAYKVAPLIVKYGGKPPPWLEPYMDEIMALFAVGLLSFSSFMQVRELKKQDQMKAANDDTNKQEAA